MVIVSGLDLCEINVMLFFDMPVTTTARIRLSGSRD
jgi:hypothetical protein